MSFGYELISETERLQEFPEFGRIVPEYRNDDIREMFTGRTGLCTGSITREKVVKLRVWHSARGTPPQL